MIDWMESQDISPTQAVKILSMTLVALIAEISELKGWDRNKGGKLIASWGENFQMPQLFAGVILLATVAIAFNETVRLLEARCSTWRT